MLVGGVRETPPSLPPLPSLKGLLLEPPYRSKTSHPHSICPPCPLPKPAWAWSQGVLEMEKASLTALNPQWVLPPRHPRPWRCAPAIHPSSSIFCQRLSLFLQCFFLISCESCFSNYVCWVTLKCSFDVGVPWPGFSCLLPSPGSLVQLGNVCFLFVPFIK